jgi:hypothetical protein
METLAPTFVSATVIATLLQLVKNSPLVPWMSRDTGKLNATVSVLAAGLAAFGLSYQTTFDAETGAFTLGFAGTLGGVVDGLAHWVGQWTAQHTVYKGFIAPAEILGEMRAIQKDALLGEAPQVKPEVPPVMSTQGGRSH